MFGKISNLWSALIAVFCIIAAIIAPGFPEFIASFYGWKPAVVRTIMVIGLFIDLILVALAALDLRQTPPDSRTDTHPPDAS